MPILYHIQPNSIPLGFAKSLSLKVSSFYHFYNSIEFCYDTPQGGPHVNKNSLFSD